LGQKSGLAVFSLNIIAQFFVGQGSVLPLPHLNSFTQQAKTKLTI
jgi:hypothetical protein